MYVFAGDNRPPGKTMLFVYLPLANVTTTQSVVVTSGFRYNVIFPENSYPVHPTLVILLVTLSVFDHSGTPSKAESTAGCIASVHRIPSWWKPTGNRMAPAGIRGHSLGTEHTHTWRSHNASDLRGLG